jgi:hypothetical protein
VFDPFFTTKPTGKGTGQGPAIIHRIVTDHHGGEIEVQSAPGRGTRFELRLPAEAAIAALTAQRARFDERTMTTAPRSSRWTSDISQCYKYRRPGPRLGLRWRLRGGTRC